MALPEGSALLRFGFIALSVAVGVGVVWCVHVAGRNLREPPATRARFTGGAAFAVTAWMILTYAIASTGILAEFDRRPPPMMLMLLTVLIVSVAIARTTHGTRLVAGLPLWILVAGQAFRFPLELLMHRAAEEGLMPMQMSYSGWNFDIVTGMTALPVALLIARRHSRARLIATAWNLIGVLLLANILVIATISTPLIAAFGPDRLNTWVAHPPYVWLPAVMVVCAITGHLIIFRKLRATATPRP